MFNSDDFKQLHQSMVDIQNLATVNADPSPIFENSEKSTLALESILSALKEEHKARIAAEKSAKLWQIISLVVGALTLIATIVFGLLTVLS